MRLKPVYFEKLIRPRFAVKLYIEKILRAYFNFDKRSVLDFGCGTGANCYMFDKDAYFGVDVDAERINYAKKRRHGYKFGCLKNNRVPAKDCTFDFICITATIHHIPDEDFEKYRDEFFRVLKPNGRIVAIEPCFFKKDIVNNSFMNFFDEGKHIRTEQAYVNLFSKMHDVVVHKRFKKFLFYNEIFFSAKKRDSTETMLD